MDIDQDNIFSFLIFQGRYQIPCNFKSIQNSPPVILLRISTILA
jgi:hypothetical protein